MVQYFFIMSHVQHFPETFLKNTNTVFNYYVSADVFRTIFATNKHISIEDYLPLFPNKQEGCEPQYYSHSDFMLFILHQEVLSVYCSHSWDPVNIVTLPLCSP